MTVAERVSLARQKRGLKKSELSAKADVSSGYLTQLENVSGDGATIKQPTLDVLQRLALALDVPVGWLAFGTEPEPEWQASASGSAA
jgi:transcriptional regulator with XRE-family HTH domain